jgi:putative DNA methylase
MNMFGSQPRPAADASRAAPRKLIEVALPLEAISEASAREKSIRHGHPSTLHLWWSRKPLAAVRAVLFAQMVDDPSAHPEEFPTEEAQQKERERLFGILEELVQWENTTNEEVLQKARREIRESWRRTCERNAGHARAAELFDPARLPAFHDPFAGGGSIPLEAQRLGLEAWASDLNPVAVLINKAMIEIPPRFAGRAPVNPDARCGHELIARPWKGAQGLAEDVRHYGLWMRSEAERRIGTLYPTVHITDEMIRERPDLERYRGRELTVIAWIWARTVRSPNPAFANIQVPLTSKFLLSTKSGKEAYVEPVIEHGGYRFRVKVGTPKDLEAAKRGTKLARGANFQCIMSGAAIKGDYIKAEGCAGRMGARLMAIVAEGDNGRVYLSPLPEHEQIPNQARPAWKPENELIGKCRDQMPLYGMNTFGDLFTPRQLVALTTFADLVPQAIARIEQDALAAGLADDRIPLAAGGSGARAYAEAVGVYLGLAVSKTANIGSSITSWMNDRGAFRETFARQAIPMMWDFAESNPFADAGGSISAAM